MNSDILYKYIDFGSGIDKILIGKTLKFSDPVKFNDPFDCADELICLTKIEEFIHGYISRKHANKNRVEKRKLLNKLLRNKAKVMSIFNDMINEQKENVRVSCFSKTESEILMWSHYANKHGGLCIGFEKVGFKELTDVTLVEINYLEEFKPYDFQIDATEAIKGWLTTKSNKWKYEMEVRLLNVQKRDIISFEPKLVKEVIFGLKVNKKIINQTVRNLIKEGYNHTEFYAMEKEENHFRLIKNKINSHT